MFFCDATLTKPAKKMMGAVWMLLAAFFYSLLNVQTRMLADLGMDPLQIAFLRSIFAFVFIAGLFAKPLIREGWAWLKPSRPSVYLLRGLTGAGGVVFYMIALANIPIAQATAIAFAAPMIGTIGSVFFLKEKVRMRRWLAVLAGFLGVLVIVRPGALPLEWGMIAALCAAISMGASIVVIKSLTNVDPSPRITLWTNLLLTLFTLPLGAAVWVEMTTEFWIWGIAAGISGGLAQLFLTMAFESADASFVVPFDYSRMPFVALLGWWVFDQKTDLYTWVGAAIIIASAIYIAHREGVRKKG